MQPRVTKRERRLHLSYELPHRIHCAQIYPVRAPNGSTVIIYGHDNGLRVLWRGGKRRKAQPTASRPPPPTPNGVPAGAEIISLDDDDDEPTPATGTKGKDEPTYEDEEDELDMDAPFAPIIEDLEISVGTDVLHVAVPTLSAAVLSLAPDILQSIALISISSADGALRVIQVPLEPPVAEEKDAAIAEISRSQIELSAGGPIPSDVSMKLVNFTTESKPLGDSRSQQRGDGAVLVAAAAQSLKVWQIQIAEGELVEPEKHQFKSQHLPASAGKISFHPFSRSGQLLVADVTGAVRIYDPFAAQASRRRPASSDSVPDPSTYKSTTGSWVMTYHTSFQEDKESPDAAPILARRKKVLDARWIVRGKAILTLLEDGEWGIWDVSTSSQPNRRAEDFLFRGYLGSSSSTDAAEAGKSRKGAPKLAPMTPNTRKAKSETLFAGTPRSADIATTGGISVLTTSPRSGVADESVALWYNGEVYAIPSIQAFWQRSTNNNNGGGGGSFGSLYSPGLTHITDVNLMNEYITSISQFTPKNPMVASGGSGAINNVRDLLISAERRLVVLQSLRPATPSRVLFQQAVAERPASRGDQEMLDAGELDIGGVDRILDSMAAGEGRARKVGFAH